MVVVVVARVVKVGVLVSVEEVAALGSDVEGEMVEVGAGDIEEGGPREVRGGVPDVMLF